PGCEQLRGGLDYLGPACRRLHPRDRPPLRPRHLRPPSSCLPTDQPPAPAVAATGSAAVVPASTSGWWQATTCPGTGAPRLSTGLSTGSSSAQRSVARGQRVRNRQPDGGSMGEGGSPA